MFIGRTDVEAETPVLWPPDGKNWFIGKDPDAGKDWRRENGMTEDEMVGWHHWLNGHEFEQALGVHDGQGGLACCSPWGRRVGQDWATELNWTLRRTVSSLLRQSHGTASMPALPARRHLSWNFITHLSLSVWLCFVQCIKIPMAFCIELDQII